MKVRISLSNYIFISQSSSLYLDYAPNSWSKRWWLLDGSLVLLYLAVFISIAFLWRPTGNNRRLAMSDELAQDEDEAEDYDLEAMEERGERAKREAMLGIDEMGGGGNRLGITDNRREGGIALPTEDVMFEIGDDAASDDEDEGRRTPKRRSEEQRGLIASKARQD